MSLRITFELKDEDLDYFRKQMKRVRESATVAPEAEVIKKAQESLQAVRDSKSAPVFVQDRLEKVERLIQMLGDEEWALEEQERKDVLTALSYFADPEDIIPDNIPVLGYIDDAIMIELVVRELIHEIEAYEDFCSYRKLAPKASHDEWLEAKRRALFSRMRRRRQGLSGGRRQTRFRLF